MSIRRSVVRPSLFDSLEPRQLLATYWVDTTIDESDGNFAAGDFSLREAVQLANATPGTDKVKFSSSIAGGTIVLNGTEIPVSDSVSIGGFNENGESSRITIRGNFASRLFNVNDLDSATLINVSLIDLTMTQGRSGNAHGGTVFSTENLSVIDSVITNSATSGGGSLADGGAIYQSGGSVTLQRSALRDSFAYRGGGMFVLDGSAVIERSEFSGNGVTWEGAGLRFRDTTTVSIRNSTFSSNSAPIWGGGIAAYNPANSDTATYLITNSTFSLNRADSDANGSGRGGAMHINGGTFRFDSNILDKNYVGNGLTIDDIDVFGSTVVDPDSANNLIGDAADGGGLIHGVNGNMVGVDAMLGFLINAGGRTMVHVPQLGSPAIDAGSNPGGLSTDQRSGDLFARAFGAGPDIGAFERQSITIDVDNAESIDDADYGAGKTTLVEAINVTNANPGADTVTVSLDGVTLAPSGTLTISDDLTLTGPGSGRFALDGSAARRVLSIGGSSSITVTLSGLTIQNGNNSTAGGLYASNTTLSLRDVTVSGNASSSWGAMRIDASALTMTDSSITGNNNTFASLGLINTSATLTRVSVTGNASSASVGGIYSDASSVLTLNRSSVSGNTASGGGNAAGGIWVFGGATITNSTISGNSSPGVGGGIYAPLSFGGSLRISNSTISGNSAGGQGGGIYLTASTASNSVIIENSTITDNRSDSDDAGGEFGGGIWFARVTSAPMTVNSTIVAMNYRGSGDANPDEMAIGNVAISSATSGNNLIGSGSSAGGLDATNGNLIGVDPLLGELADNGGPTMTHALLSGSPAINSGSNPSGLSADQRSEQFARSADGPDIGSYERQVLALTVDLATDESDGDHSAGDLSLREAIELSNGNPFDDTISFGTSLGDRIRLDWSGSSFPELVISDDVAITGPGFDKLRIDGMDATRILRIDDGDSSRPISVTISGLRLTRGQAGNGGAIDNVESLTLTNVKLDSNNANNDGGAIRNRGSLFITSSVISNNAAGDSGGAIDNDGATTVEITGSVLRNNTAAGSAGAIDNDAGASLQITRSELSGNVSGGDGGAIDTAGTLTVSESTLNSNMAANGGALENSGRATITDVTMAGNAAAGGGGAIDNFGGTLTIVRSTLSGNTTAGSGGAIWTDTVLTIQNSTLSGNSAADFGGAIGMFDGTVVISNSTLANNAAETNGDGVGQGGAIDVGNRNGPGTLTTTSSIYSGNTRAGSADEISLTGGSVSGTNNLVNHAGSSGGLTHGLNGNIVGQDPLLGDLANNGGPTQTHAIFPGSPAIDSGWASGGTSTDQRGNARLAGGGVDIGAFEWAPSAFSLTSPPASLVTGSADSDDTQNIVARNVDGDWIFFRGSGTVWQVQRLRDYTDAGAATGDALVWNDPNDGLTYVAGPSADGFLLFQRATDGTWSYRNLSNELSLGSGAPVGRMTQFTTISQRVSIAGYTASNQLVLLQQTGTTGGTGANWSFKNLSNDLTSQGMTTPNLVDITSYVTPWDQWTIAGIDSSGNVQGVWVFTPSFTTWRVDNLSALYGTPTLTGQLTVIQTAWNAINLAASDVNGNLVVTWWVPRFRSTGWAINNLTDEQSGTKLAGGRITGFVTPWGAMNYAGLDASGEIVAYWWTPALKWNVSSLTQRIESGLDRPTGTITNNVSGAGTMNVMGTANDGGITRLWWTPNSDNLWKITDLSDVAVRV